MKFNQLFNELKEKHFLGVLVAGFFLVVFWAASLPGAVPAPQEVRIGNASDTSLSIAWLTAKPTRGGLVLTAQDNRFLRFAQFFVLNYFSWGSSFLPDEAGGPSTVHLVNLKNLEPGKAYYYRIVSNSTFFKRDESGQLLPPIRTAPVLNALSLPNPLYSYVLDEEQQPLAGALVSLSLLDGQNRNIIKSQPLLTLTDQQGLWLFDLGNLRSFSLNEAAKPSPGDLLFIQVQTSDGQTTAEFREVGQTKSLAPIVVR